MFKVSVKKDVGMMLSPAWDKTTPKRLSFNGMLVCDDDPQYFYVALWNAHVNEAKQWKDGSYEDVDNFPDPVFLRLLKKEITYKGRDGKPDNTIKPTEWDLFFIELFKETAAQHPDGQINGMLDCTESNLGFANRYKVEASPEKKAMLLEAFYDIKPLTEGNKVDDISDTVFKVLTASNPFSGGSKYPPKEKTSEVLQAKLDFVRDNLAIALDEDGDQPMPLHIYVMAIQNMDEKKKQAWCKYLELLINLANG